MTFDLTSLGWDDSLAAGYPPRGADHRPGRVVRADPGVCTVICADGAVRASLAGAILTAVLRDPANLPCAGDWVVVRTWPDGRVTADAVLPRRTAVVRAAVDKEATGRVLAANLDTAAVVEPAHPAPDLDRVGRLLALARRSGARALVVLTKADLCRDPGAVAARVAAATPGVDVVAVAAGRGVGLDAVRPLVAAGRTLALLGPVGAGKSTLVNALAGATVLGTRAMRRAGGPGRDGDTHWALIPIPGGGAVLDGPGIPAGGYLDAAVGRNR